VQLNGHGRPANQKNRNISRKDEGRKGKKVRRVRWRTISRSLDVALAISGVLGRKKNAGATGWSPLDLKAWHVQICASREIFKPSNAEYRKGTACRYTMGNRSRGSSRSNRSRRENVKNKEKIVDRDWAKKKWSGRVDLNHAGKKKIDK